MKYADFGEGPYCKSCGQRPTGCKCPLAPLGYVPPNEGTALGVKSAAANYRGALIRIQSRVRNFQALHPQGQGHVAVDVIEQIDKIISGVLK